LGDVNLTKKERKMHVIQSQKSCVHGFREGKKNHYRSHGYEWEWKW